mgnify:CR=1 FL=1
MGFNFYVLLVRRGTMVLLEQLEHLEHLVLKESQVVLEKKVLQAAL